MNEEQFPLSINLTIVFRLQDSFPSFERKEIPRKESYLEILIYYNRIQKFSTLFLDLRDRIGTNTRQQRYLSAVQWRNNREPYTFVLVTGNLTTMYVQQRRRKPSTARSVFRKARKKYQDRLHDTSYEHHHDITVPLAYAWRRKQSKYIYIYRRATMDR